MRDSSIRAIVLYVCVHVHVITGKERIVYTQGFIERMGALELPPSKSFPSPGFRKS